MGRKYIIELEDKNVWECGYPDRMLSLDMTVLGKALTNVNTGIPLTPYTEPDLEQIGKEAYDKGYDDATAEIGSDEQTIAEKAYQKGLSDAWKCARKFMSEVIDVRFRNNFMVEIFRCDNAMGAMKVYSASECIEKIRQYEQRQEEQITKGDIVLIKSTPEVEILVTYADEEYVSGIAMTEVDGNCEIGDQYTNIRICNVEKTGKHYDIVSVLQKMREESNG